MMGRALRGLLWTPVQFLLMLLYTVIVLAKALLLIGLVIGAIALGSWVLHLLGH